MTVSLDPERDSPEALRAYAERLGANPEGLAIATGTPGAGEAGGRRRIRPL